MMTDELDRLRTRVAELEALGEKQRTEPSESAEEVARRLCAYPDDDHAIYARLGKRGPSCTCDAIAQALLAFRAAGVREAEEKFQRMIPVLLTWKENMATEAECAQARDDLVAAGITPEYIASLSIANTTPGGSET